MKSGLREPGAAPTFRVERTDLDLPPRLPVRCFLSSGRPGLSSGRCFFSFQIHDAAPEIDQNPYHPYEETDRYRAFRDGCTAQREQRPRSANPYPFAQISRVLAWLDGWTAASEDTNETKRRQRREAHQVRQFDFVLDGLEEGASEFA